MSRLHDLKKEHRREKGVLERIKDKLLEPANPAPNEQIKPMKAHELKAALKKMKEKK
jgi:hypothetical protein